MAADEDLEELSGVGPDTHHPQNHGNEDHTADFETTGGAQDRVDTHEAKENPHADSLDIADYNPESDTHTRYGDGEARSAVDGSNVSVGYADDAGELGGRAASKYLTGGSVTSNSKTGSLTVYDRDSSETKSYKIIDVGATFPVFVDIYAEVYHDSNDDFDRASTTVNVIANYADGSSTQIFSVSASRGGNSGTSSNSGATHLANGDFSIEPKQIDTIEVSVKFELDNGNSSNTINSDHEATVDLGYM